MRQEPPETLNDGGGLNATIISDEEGRTTPRPTECLWARDWLADAPSAPQEHCQRMGVCVRFVVVMDKDTSRQRLSEPADCQNKESGVSLGWIKIPSGPRPTVPSLDTGAAHHSE